MKTSLIYITASTFDEAKTIGRELVSSRLAACANIIDNMSSIYWWEGEIQNAKEAVLILKTKESLIGELVEKVKSMHSYDLPCIVSLPISDGSRPFLDWIAEETE